jgi:hypothetical protein
MKANNNRKKIPPKMLKHLQKEINSKCPICRNEDVKLFEVHHIDSISSNNDERNLIMLCPNCHTKVTQGDYSVDYMYNLKIKLMLNATADEEPISKCNIIEINSDVNNSVFANEIHAKNINLNRKSKVKMSYPEGSIGADVNRKIYAKHLIDRYNDFTKDDEYKPKFSYSVIYTNIKKQFGASCYNIPINRFDDLCVYLQNKIRNTRLGRILNSRGQKLFSTFEEYIEKYCN